MSKKSNKKTPAAKPRAIVVGDLVCCHGGEGNSDKVGGEFEVLSVSGADLEVRCIHSGYETMLYTCDVYRI